LHVGIVLEQLLGPVPGGTGRAAAQLAAALGATAGPHDHVTGWVGAHRDAGPARIVGVGGPRRLPLGRRALAVAWERGHGPAPHADVVHAPTLLLPPRRPGQALVVTVHDAVPWTHPQLLTARGVAFHRRMAGRAVREAAAIVTPSAAAADELARHLDVPRERLHVVPNGVTAEAVTPPPDAARRAARLALPDAYLLTLATLEPRKGLDTVLQALAEPGAPDLPLLVVGQAGWGGVDPVALAAGLGLTAGRVRVLGRLTDPDLATVLGRASVLVSPSRSEGFGLPVLEGLAAGIPVVASDIPAHAEVAGDSALLVPPDDPVALAAAITQAATDIGLRRASVQAGLQRAAQYSWQTAARSCWRLYRKISDGEDP
jgi:glycosyltransferase involved in cell wall biosynthesis